eukprot:1384096-Amorphochlora_amoeboformis.AAC.2
MFHLRIAVEDGGKSMASKTGHRWSYITFDLPECGPQNVAVVKHLHHHLIGVEPDANPLSNLMEAFLHPGLWLGVVTLGAVSKHEGPPRGCLVTDRVGDLELGVRGHKAEGHS